MNMAAYLGATIESVFANLASDDEYFVIDGASTDGSVDVIRRYADRLTGWVSEPDRGYADALRKGFARATGDVLCWINAGDLLLPGALDAAREALEETGSDMIFGDDFYIDEAGKVISFSRGYIRDLRSGPPCSTAAGHRSRTPASGAARSTSESGESTRRYDTRPTTISSCASL
jgi:glycosyltransferase involved in cell wall biosynthesis